MESRKVAANRTTRVVSEAMATTQPKRLARTLVAGASVVLVSTWCMSAEAPTHAERAPDVYVECPTVVDVRQEGTLSAQAGRAVPAKPEEWQKRAPCSTDTDEVDIRGGCYLELARKPPCKPGQYESGGKCFAAIARQKRPDTSVEGTRGE